MYLTYEEYMAMGGTLEASAFLRAVPRACAIIDSATQKRCKQMHDVPEEIKYLTRDIVDYISVSCGASQQVASESQTQGGTSESVSYSVPTTDERTTHIDDLIYDYLHTVTNDNGTPLLYRGCCD